MSLLDVIRKAIQDYSELCNSFHRGQILNLGFSWKGNLWGGRRDILQSQERNTVGKRERAVRYGTSPAERLAFPFRGGSRKHSFFTSISSNIWALQMTLQRRCQNVLSLRCLSTYRALGLSRGRKVVACSTILIDPFHPSYNCAWLIPEKEPH